MERRGLGHPRSTWEFVELNDLNQYFGIPERASGFIERFPSETEFEAKNLTVFEDWPPFAVFFRSQLLGASQVSCILSLISQEIRRPLNISRFPQSLSSILLGIPFCQARAEVLRTLQRLLESCWPLLEDGHRCSDENGKFIRNWGFHQGKMTRFFRCFLEGTVTSELKASCKVYSNSGELAQVLFPYLFLNILRLGVDGTMDVLWVSTGLNGWLATKKKMVQKFHRRNFWFGTPRKWLWFMRNSAPGHNNFRIPTKTLVPASRNGRLPRFVEDDMPIEFWRSSTWEFRTMPIYRHSRLETERGMMKLYTFLCSCWFSRVDSCFGFTCQGSFWLFHRKTALSPKERDSKLRGGEHQLGAQADLSGLGRLPADWRFDSEPRDFGLTPRSHVVTSGKWNHSRLHLTVDERCLDQHCREHPGLPWSSTPKFACSSPVFADGRLL